MEFEQWWDRQMDYYGWSDNDNTRWAKAVAEQAWNASHYPGTRQMCSQCGQPTGRCEDDTLFNEEEPLCEEGWAEIAQEV